MSVHNKRLGALGEAVAAEYLSDKGMTVVEKNYRTKSGEIDIIAVDGDTLVFVEVKTRTSERFGRGACAVNQKKIKKIIEVASEYIYNKDIKDTPIRVDVIEIHSGVGVAHYKNITE